jgi:hypothetical protein
MCEWVNQRLGSDPHLAQRLPLLPQDLCRATADGLIFWYVPTSLPMYATRGQNLGEAGGDEGALAD